MALLARRVPEADVTLDVPEDWVVGQSPGLLLAAIDPTPAPFGTNVTVTLDPSAAAPDPDGVTAVLAGVVAGVPIDLRSVEEPLPGVELLFCHLAGTASVTALQRQLSTAGGVLTVTVSCATADWPRFEGVAEEIVGSVAEASS